MRFTYDPNGTPSDTSATPAVTGSRIKQIVLLNSDGSDKQVLDRNDTSTKIVLATNDYENAGGDGYTMLSEIKNIGEGEALDVVTADYIEKLTTQGNGTFSYPNSQNRICVDSSFVYSDYIATITLTDKSGSAANQQVLYSLDNTSAAYGTTDEKGVLTIPNLTFGAHTIYVYLNEDTTAAYVDNTIRKTAVVNDMTAQSDDQTIAFHMMQTILALPADITSADADTVNITWKSYENLTAAQKGFVANASLLLAAKEIALSGLSEGSESSAAVSDVSGNNSFISVSLIICLIVFIILAAGLYIFIFHKNKSNQ